MIHDKFDALVTAMGRETVVELADYAVDDPTWVPALIEACKHPKPKNRDRKAAWVLHHIFLRHPELIEGRAEELLDILDDSEDTSVYREILKILPDIKLSADQMKSIKDPMLELGIGLLHDENWSKGMHYIAMRLVQRFAETKSEKFLSIEAVEALLSRTSSNEKPMCNAATKVAKKMKKSIAALSTVLVLFISGCGTSSSEKTALDMSVLDEVDVFVGTSEMGHVFPGATVPFGMVQLSPETDSIPFLHDGRYTGEVYRYCAGYQYSDSTVVGFSHTHFSGTGHSDLGDIRLMPTVGDIMLNPGTSSNPESGYRSRFYHDNENGSPGRYSTYLSDYDIKVDLTSSTRVGVHKYEYSEGSETGNIIIDLEAGIYDYPGKDVWTFVRVENDTLITGYKMCTGWAKTRTIYFAMSFSQPIANYGHKRLDDAAYGGFWRRFDMDENFPEMAGRRIVAWTEFDLSESNVVEVQVALSPTGIDGALKNLEAETSGKKYEKIHDEARALWASELSRIQVKMDGDDDVSVFRTALYHTCLGPTIYSDVDGRYRGLDQTDHNGVDQWGKFQNYTTFSLWDTYRSLHPWFNLFQPERNRDMSRSMLAHHDQSVHGMLPIWSHHANDNWCMIGYHAVSVLADAIAKDVIVDPSLIKASLEASVETASHPTFDGLDHYKELGYVPCDEEGSSVSKTLEMSYDDWCISEIARSLDEDVVAQEFSERGEYFKNNWDEKSGFMRPRYSDGTFKEEFDVLSTHGQGFIEGNAWNYSLHVQHDVNWLIEAHGGNERFVAHLDSLFTMELPDEAIAHTEDVTRDGLIGNYVHGNEPSHHAAWMFTLAGRPDLTQVWTREIVRSMYGSGIDGLCGNDDAGQMSAWYLFASLGFYPLCPGDSRYVLGSPSVERAEIDLGNGKTLVVSTSNQHSANVYVQEVTWNSEIIEGPWIEHNLLEKGGELHFELGPTPSLD
jgi:predicted alpha-1,2-mannosidase